MWRSSRDRTTLLAFVPDRLKTEGFCIKAVRRNSHALGHVPDYLNTQKICNVTIRENPAAFFLLPDRFKTPELCEIAVGVDPWQLNDIPDYLKTKKMCDDVVWSDPYSLQFVPDWFVTHQQIKIWRDDDEYCDDNELIEWYDGYQKRKEQKAPIKEELLPIAWHPDRVMDWCMSEDEKRLWK